MNKKSLPLLVLKLSHSIGPRKKKATQDINLQPYLIPDGPKQAEGELLLYMIIMVHAAWKVKFKEHIKKNKYAESYYENIKKE